MRVIAGTHRSRQLVSPRGTTTRPTSDRLRETLFNILAPRVPGARVLDLYAGTGAVGIEAISRGAAHVWFTENDKSALTALRANLSALKITNSYTVEDRSTGALLERLIKLPQLAQTIDLVFLDPPYEAAAEYEATLALLGSPRGRQLLAPDALVIAEHGTKSPLATRYGALRHTRLVKQGDASLSFYALPSEEPSSEA
jgi:16S rRNA (guanine966-N2)-methyltransferase